MSKNHEMAEAFTIFAKYEGDSLHAEHDILYAGPSDIASMSPEDVKRLDELGWFIEDESWAKFT